MGIGDVCRAGRIWGGYKTIKAGKKMQKNENESGFFVWRSAQKQQFACSVPIFPKIRKRGILWEKEVLKWQKD